MCHIYGVDSVINGTPASFSPYLDLDDSANFTSHSNNPGGMTSSTGKNSSQETSPITSTLNGRPCSPFISPRVLACFNSASHAAQGTHSEAKCPTNWLLEICAYEARNNIEEVDRWIEATRELERKGKDLTEWKATLGELLGKFEAVHG